MLIDCQSHIFPDPYAEIIKRNPRPPRLLTQGEDYVISYGNVQKFRLNRQAYDIKRKIKDMDAAGVDMSILSINIPGPEMLIPELGVVGARVCNDFLAEICHRQSDRFVGLACLPWQEVSAAIQEMDRAIGELKLRGIMLYSHIRGNPVDAPVYEPIYQRAEELGVPIVLHPTVPVWGEAIKDYWMIPMVGMMVDHSFAMLRLILGGVLERHPRLKIVQPHLGGVLPYLIGRVDYQTEVMGRGIENITQAPSRYYQRIYLDTVSTSALALRYACEFVGPDRLLFGSDHPWMDISLFVELINQMDIPAEEKDKIFGLNAQRLFKI